MRIVSLVPAATEIAGALGALDELVAVTHDDDYPPEVESLPHVTTTTIPHGASQGDIDALVREAAQRGESTFHLDVNALRAARPDVILGQSLCRVCALTLEHLPRDIRPAPRVVPLDGESIEGIFADVRRVGKALGRDSVADRLVASLRGRLGSVERAVAGRPRPRVACLEWLDPLFVGGHWVPEQVALAGGEDVLGRPGERSRVVALREVADALPEVLVLMPCGFDARRAHADAALLARDPHWPSIPAVRRGEVFAVDGAAYFSRPGPRVVDGAELLASLFHPGAVDAPLGAEALRVG